MVSHISDWKAARKFPRTYPGDRPDTSYLLLDERVYPLLFERAEDLSSAFFIDENATKWYVDEVLKSLELPFILDRYAILAYGANRNPATIEIKLRNYHYQSPGRGWAIPVLKGTLRGADVVAGDVYGQGYMYADLLLDEETCRDTTVESWLLLLDDDQLRVMNDSEGLAEGIYLVAQFPGYTIEGPDYEIAPLGYAGNSPIFISPALHKPLSFTTIAAFNRTLPAFDPVTMFDHLLDVFDIRHKVSDITGLDHDESLSTELTKYLNGQWWYAFNTRDKPTKGYLKVMELFSNCVRSSSRQLSTADNLSKKGRALTMEASYRPGIDHTIRAMLDR